MGTMYHGAGTVPVDAPLNLRYTLATTLRPQLDTGRRIPARIQNFDCVYICDFRHRGPRSFLQPLSNYHHRTVSVPENLFSRGPNQHLLEPRFTAPAKYDQIDKVCFRSVYDLLNRVSNRNRSFKLNF